MSNMSPPPEISTPSSLTFFKNRETRKTCFYCHFIYNFLSCTYSRISTKRKISSPPQLSTLSPTNAPSTFAKILDECPGSYSRNYSINLHPLDGQEEHPVGKAMIIGYFTPTGIYKLSLKVHQYSFTFQDWVRQYLSYLSKNMSQWFTQPGFKSLCYLISQHISQNVGERVQDK